MRILIITNSILTPVPEHFNINQSVRGGWVYSSVKRLVETETVAVASVHNCKELIIYEDNNVKYYLVPSGNKAKYSTKMESYWKQIKEDFCPEITHIYGTEYPLTLNYINACGNEKVIISIQGLISEYLPYYYGGLTFREILFNLTFYDIIHGVTLFNYRRSFKKRAKYEIAAIKKTKFIEGRTSWDKQNCWAINPDAIYFHCDRTLRDEFYRNKWEYANCIKHSIFLSQGQTPLKGFHKMLEALSIIKIHYPDVKLFITTNIDFSNSTLNDILFGKGYNLYIKKLIKKLKLEENIVCTGLLSEIEMCKMYLKSNVFVCPSSIENSPNSVGEAQILGVPCIASYVGGSMDMVKDSETGFLYRFEETAMLAYNVCKVFEQKENIDRLSQMEREVAYERHNPDENFKKILNIYKSIVK